MLLGLLCCPMLLVRDVAMLRVLALAMLVSELMAVLMAMLDFVCLMRRRHSAGLLQHHLLAVRRLLLVCLLVGMLLVFRMSRCLACLLAVLLCLGLGDTHQPCDKRLAHLTQLGWRPRGEVLVALHHRRAMVV